jgi:chemotaxis signal transduction protein
MPAISALSSFRKSSSDRREVAPQLVAFRLRFAWFVLPVTSLYRVLPLEKMLPTLTHGGQPVPMIDVAQSLFGNTSKKVPLLYIGGSPVPAKPCLLIVQNAIAQLVALRSDSQPALLRIAPDLFLPLPTNAPARWRTCISGMTKPLDDNPSLFAIDPELLITAKNKDLLDAI